MELEGSGERLYLAQGWPTCLQLCVLQGLLGASVGVYSVAEVTERGQTDVWLWKVRGGFSGVCCLKFLYIMQ